MNYLCLLLKSIEAYWINIKSYCDIKSLNWIQLWSSWQLPARLFTCDWLSHLWHLTQLVPKMFEFKGVSTLQVWFIWSQSVDEFQHICIFFPLVQFGFTKAKYHANQNVSIKAMWELSLRNHVNQIPSLYILNTSWFCVFLAVGLSGCLPRY